LKKIANGFSLRVDMKLNGMALSCHVQGFYDKKTIKRDLVPTGFPAKSIISYILTIRGGVQNYQSSIRL
jgi:hypothetical protein